MLDLAAEDLADSTRRYRPFMSTPALEHHAFHQLRQLLDASELDPARRERLFESFGGPRAAVVNGLTDAVLRFIVEQGAALRGADVLDYGCGIMPYFTAFSHAGAHVIGADIGGNPHADVCISEGETLPLSDRSIDYVVSFQVLEHVPLAHDYITEAHRVLKPGGKLFLTTHGLWPYHPTPTDYHRWTRDGLVWELERAGFRVESCNHILNEYSAAVQYLVMSGEYRGVWRRSGFLVHFLTHCVIRLMESCGHHQPQFPACLCITGVRL